MIKVGNWHIPERDATKDKIKEMCEKEVFQCASALERAFVYVKNFNTAIDIGTWIGDSTWLMGNKFKNVIGFEASPVVYECCIKNLEEKKMSNCQVHNLGLSNKKGTQYLFNKGKTFSGWISSLELTEENKKSGISVETDLLDNLNYENIDFIKIDVDSHEGFLVDGAKEFFKRNSPVVMIENKVSSHDRQSALMPDALAILKSLNYIMVEKTGKADFIFVKR
jgi:FkbM family methyltransferase